jgi:hypothetical protein
VAIEEQQHIALPRLYGAPAYARPRRPVDDKPKPFDPDDMPLEAQWTEDDRAFAETLPARVYAPGGGYMASGQAAAMPATPSDQDPALRPRPLSLKSISGLFRGGGSSS